MSVSIFDGLVSLYRTVDFDGPIEGMLRLSSSEMVALAKELLQRDPDHTGLTLLSGDATTLTIGSEVRIQVNPPRRGLGVVATDIYEFLAGNRLSEPRRYYLRMEDYLKGETHPPPLLQRYQAVLDFIDLLTEAAAYLDVPKEELVFIQGGRFIVPIVYDPAALTVPLIDSIASLQRQFTNDMHRVQKLEILASTVHDLTAGRPSAERFAVLLADITALATKVEDGYRLFASGFSYDKIWGEIQDANIEFTGKLHKTFSDIQSQLLAIPVATVIVATQLKYSEGIGSQFWINTGVVIGSLLFTVLTWLLVTNQRQTMAVLGKEIERREQVIAKEHSKVKDLFEESFRTLRKRLDWQKLILRLICVIVLFGFIATVIVYAYLLYVPI